MIRKIPYWHFIVSKYNDNEEADSIIRYSDFKEISDFLYKSEFVEYTTKGISIKRFLIDHDWYIFFKEQTRINAYRQSIFVNFFLFKEGELEKINFLSPYFFADLYFPENNPFTIEVPTKIIHREDLFVMELNLGALENARLDKNIPIDDFFKILLRGKLDYETILSSRGHIIDLHITFRKFCLIDNDLESVFYNEELLLNQLVDILTNSNTDIKEYGELLIDSVKADAFYNFTYNLLLETEIFNLLINNELPDKVQREKIDEYILKQENDLNNDNPHINSSFINNKNLFYRLIALQNCIDVKILDINTNYNKDYHPLVYQIAKNSILDLKYKSETVSILLSSQYLENLTLPNYENDFKTSIALKFLEEFDYVNNKLGYDLFVNCYKYCDDLLRLETLEKAIMHIERKSEFLNKKKLDLIKEKYDSFRYDDDEFFKWTIKMLGYESELHLIITEVWGQRFLRDKVYIKPIIQFAEDYALLKSKEYNKEYDKMVKEKKKLDDDNNIPKKTKNTELNKITEEYCKQGKKVFKETNDIFRKTNNDKINTIIKDVIKEKIELKPEQYQFSLDEKEKIDKYEIGIEQMSLYAFYRQIIA